MTQSEFQRNAQGAKMLGELSTDDLHSADFWSGYQRGLRRNYHGGKFGTSAEHKLWLVAADQRHDEQRRYRGIGYRAGFDGMSISDAIQHLAKFTAASLAGSVSSRAKTLAARENAKQPRPNAQGKSKPRKKKIT